MTGLVAQFKPGRIKTGAALFGLRFLSVVCVGGAVRRSINGAEIGENS